MTKKTLAREWLLLVVCLFTGWVVAPLAVVAVTGTHPVGFSTLELFWWSLQRFDTEAWIIFLGPYLITQFTRSVAWAIRASR